jgi:hypothetical protein
MTIVRHTVDPLQPILEFEAPYLERKLSSCGLVDSPAEAAQLFREVKRYLALSSLQPAGLAMVSSLVDAAWHQFILFTAEYAEFCRQSCGRYIHHVPQLDRANASAEPAARESLSPAAAFRELYEARFGALPDVWYDERCLRMHTCIVRPDSSDRFSVDLDGSDARLVRTREAPQVVCRTSLRARPALDFIAAHPVFLVRELPGLASQREHLELIRPLVEFGILRIAL